MAVIDFNEIPESNIANGKQDEFELFAREFLTELGFTIIDGPDRGSDGGRDLIVEEKRGGIIGDTAFKWLVSCKHKSHSKSSVSTNEEENISDRVKQFQCDGFIGFYSSVPSSGLNNRLNSFKGEFEIKIFDNEIIERYLLSDRSMEKIVKRFFPISYGKIFDEKYKPRIIFNKYQPLYCDVCGKDLLERKTLENSQGIIAFVVKKAGIEEGKYRRNYSSIYCACKGKCDRYAEYKYLKDNMITEWEDISDLTNPKLFLEFVMGFINGIYYKKDLYSEESFKRIKEILLIISQVVVREMTDEEKERYEELLGIPKGL